MARLDGKVAIITGGASGMGESHTRLFVKEGAKVVFTDIQVDLGKKIEEELGENALFLEHDVANASQWEEVVKKTEEKFGPVNVLVNNAGISGAMVPIDEFTEEDYEKVYGINQKSVYYGMKYAIPSMKKSDAGSIVNISSLAGIVGQKGGLAYTGTKFAVRGMTKVAAAELGEFNIRANSVHPGVIETQMVKAAAEQYESVANDLKALREGTPLKRGAEPIEVSNLVLFLASDESSYINGEEIVIDGGSNAIS
ncbi:SDR family NAD(P)-dependent oxidoreductase [Aliicoccus persicus]|uniref:Diacetyl reductase [(S)-acetoin forming] n=1 Tax=Aliicoccus persicus TaxID=930138 RepID=A0A662Z2L1_9STAP|nr:glucose 1-dehydrogenase [Aliicoccus persicus]SEV81324.1 3alpha(or 20beta)-hydroxysteroid dehydrogenase [Aliicoccus persicus]HJE19709.1 glucose 1-dehydrogenase [Aliicoccus persicus]